MMRFTGGRAFTLLILILLTALAPAQWVHMNGPGGATVNSLAASGRDLYAATHYFGVYRSVDGGRSWAPTSSGWPRHAETRALAVCGNYLFAGTSEGLYRSSDNGSTWDSTGPGSLFLAVNDSYLFLARHDSLMRSSDAGTTWESASDSLPSHRFLDAFFARGATLLAGIGDSLFRSTDNGSHWTRVVNGLPFDRIQALGSNGPDLYAGLDYWGIYRSTDNGVSWARANEGMRSTGFVNVFVGNAGGFYVGTAAGVYRTTDNGAHWAQVIDGLWHRNVLAFATLSDTLLAGCQYGGVFRSTDAGSKWVASNTGLSLTYVQALAADGPRLFAGTNKGFFLSEDTGETWREAEVARPLVANIADLAVLRDSTGRATYFATFGGYIYRSTDQGGNWVAVDTLGSGLLGVSGPYLLAAGRGMVYLSADYGTTWKEVATGYPSAWFVDFAGDDTNLFAAARQDGVSRSTDDGLTWAATNPGSPYWDVSSVALCGMHLFAGTFGMGVFYSTDRGATWDQTRTGLATIWVNSLVVIDANVLAATADGVFVTSDSGLSWRHVSEGLPPYPSPQTLAANDTFLFVGTNGQGIWRRRLSEVLTGVEANRRLPVDFELEQNYPNPFNPSATIRYAAPRRSYVTLTVFNMLGQQVALLVDGEVEAGVHEVQFDGSALASGVYFYRLQAGAFIQVRKLCLVK